MNIWEIIATQGKQYLKDAMPGGLLNRELDYEGLRKAGEVASMTPTPLGDAMSGLLAVDDIRNKNYGSAALNSIGLLPFVPGMAGVTKSFWNDVPNNSWLKEQVDYAISKGKDKFGVPYMGKATAGFKEPVEVPLDTLLKLKGQRGEQANIRKDDLDWLVKEMKKNGLKNIGNPYIEVGYNGIPWISEGNHRIMAAKMLGLEKLPVELKYFEGGEGVEGLLNPKNISN